MTYAISANRLTDGLVIFLSLEGWVESLAQAQRFPDKATAQATLETRGKADAARNLLLDPAVFEVREAGGRPEAAHIREAIRAKGPSVRPDLGKQGAGQ